MNNHTRLSLKTLGTFFLATSACAGKFTIYPDSSCNRASSDSYNVNGNIGCTRLTASRDGFRLDEPFGTCILTLHPDNDCQRTGQQYDGDNVNVCISPRFGWNSFQVRSC
jgi:hypothetical protein